MELPFCPACGSVRLAEEGGRLDGQAYHRIRCRDCLWAEPLGPSPEPKDTEPGSSAPARSGSA